MATVANALISECSVLAFDSHVGNQEATAIPDEVAPDMLMPDADRHEMMRISGAVTGRAASGGRYGLFFTLNS